MGANYGKRLGRLLGASHGALAETVSLHEHAQTLQLALVGAIEYTELPTEPGTPRDLRWTEFGDSVLSACGAMYPQEQSTK